VQSQCSRTRFGRSLSHPAPMPAWRLWLLFICCAGCARAPLGLRSVDGGRLAKPQYPSIAMASGIEGESVVILVWRDDGTVDSARTRRLRESHPHFTEAVMKAARQWRVLRSNGDSVRVEASFALTRSCARRDSRMERASRANLRAEGGVLRILVEAEDCRPYRPPIATRAGSLLNGAISPSARE
jgi:TonB family protein